MTRKNYSSKKGGKKTNKRYSKKKGGINWKFWEKKPVDAATTVPEPPTATAPTCPPCPVCQQSVPPAVAEAIKEEEPSSPALENQLGGGKKRKTRRNRSKKSNKSKKSKKLWFQIGCVKI